MAGATDNEPTHGSQHAHSEDTPTHRQTAAGQGKARQGNTRRKRREETIAAARRHTTHESVCTHHTRTHTCTSIASSRHHTTPMPSQAMHQSNPLREKRKQVCKCSSVCVCIDSIHPCRPSSQIHSPTPPLDEHSVVFRRRFLACLASLCSITDTALFNCSKENQPTPCAPKCLSAIPDPTDAFTAMSRHGRHEVSVSARCLSVAGTHLVCASRNDC
mmetsp:Transcript_19717/g.47783  ORF Transcript_19717/g.47783 Transcript_19717/m.47783 type:complete len:217 (-) Transcript_19717:423-1073(-)